MRLRTEVYDVITNALENGIDDPSEFTEACFAAAGVMKRICDYIEKHGDIALSIGSEWMYQDDEAQVDALQLVADIIDDLEGYAEYND